MGLALGFARDGGLNDAPLARAVGFATPARRHLPQGVRSAGEEALAPPSAGMSAQTEGLGRLDIGGPIGIAQNDLAAFDDLLRSSMGVDPSG